MTAAVMKTIEYAKPVFGRPVFTKPSHATLRKIEIVLTVTLAAQIVGLVIRYTL